MNDTIEFVRRERPDQGMNVIVHDDIWEELITLPIKAADRRRHQIEFPRLEFLLAASEGAMK
jgi:hypothetical protein